MADHDVIEKPPGDTGDDLMKKLFPNGPIELDPDQEDEAAKEPEKNWCNWYKWMHPTEGLPRPTGEVIPPGGEFRTRGEHPSKEAAVKRAEDQLYGVSGAVWPPAVRCFLKYLGPRKVDE